MQYAMQALGLALICLGCGPTGPKPLTADEKATCERAQRTFVEARAIRSDSIADANPDWQKSNDLWRNAIAGVTNARLKDQCVGIDPSRLYETWMNFLDRSLDRLERDDTFMVTGNDMALALATAPFETGPQEFFGPGLFTRFDRASKASWARRFKKAKKLEDLASKEPLCVFSSQSLGNVDGAQVHNAWVDYNKETWGRCAFPGSLKEWKHEGADEVIVSWLTWDETAGKPSLEYLMTVKGVQPMGDHGVMFHFQPKAAFKTLKRIHENHWAGLHVSYVTKAKVESKVEATERASGVVLVKRGKK